MHNRDPKPSAWTAKADDILQKVIRANRRLSSRNSEALHWFLQFTGTLFFQTWASMEVVMSQREAEWLGMIAEVAAGRMRRPAGSGVLGALVSSGQTAGACLAREGASGWAPGGVNSHRRFTSAVPFRRRRRTCSRRRARAFADQHSNWGATRKCHVVGTTMYRIRDTHGDNHRFRISKALNVRAVSILECGMQSAVTNLTRQRLGAGRRGAAAIGRTGHPVTLPSLRSAQSLDLGGSISVLDTV